MKKNKILTLNNIASIGLDLFSTDKYEFSSEFSDPDAIVLRSSKMHSYPINERLKAVARAGAGTNNIPVNKLTQFGIPVFNAPGANANAVKELVLASMLLSARNLCEAWNFTLNLKQTGSQLEAAVENGKKKYTGFELKGKTLGVVGLGAIGVKVANAALDLEMKVIGYDPKITISNAWQLEANVEPMSSLELLLSQADFITFHVPLVEATKNMFNLSVLDAVKPQATIINLARQAIVCEDTILEGIKKNLIKRYFTDFPSEKLQNNNQIIALPHLGASTKEAEENCAELVINQLIDFLENGNIVNSVNFPTIKLLRNPSLTRLVITNQNIPGIVGKITTELANNNINIINMLNSSSDSVACTIVDCDTIPDKSLRSKLQSIEGLLTSRIC